MSASVEHYMTEIYCFEDNVMKPHPRLSQWRHSPHAQPRFSDGAGLTITLWQGVLAVAPLNRPIG